jgi:hypothetical protein
MIYLRTFPVERADCADRVNADCADRLGPHHKLVGGIFRRIGRSLWPIVEGRPFWGHAGVKERLFYFGPEPKLPHIKGCLAAHRHGNWLGSRRFG